MDSFPVTDHRTGSGNFRSAKIAAVSSDSLDGDTLVMETSHIAEHPERAISKPKRNDRPHLCDPVNPKRSTCDASNRETQTYQNNWTSLVYSSNSKATQKLYCNNCEERRGSNKEKHMVQSIHTEGREPLQSWYKD